MTLPSARLSRAVLGGAKGTPDPSRVVSGFAHSLLLVTQDGRQVDKSSRASLTVLR